MTPKDRPIRVMFYVQHLLGIGHLARASRIANALAADGCTVTVVTGGKPVPGFPGPAVRHIQLPPVVAGDAGFRGLKDAEGNTVDDAFKARRSALLIQTFHDCAPDVVMIEQFPFGRRQLQFELLPLLDAVHAMPARPIVLSSLRDILQERGRPDRDQETVVVTQRYFDHVLVHGDPGFARLEDTFPFADAVMDKVIYTGLVAAPAPQPTSDRFDILVSAGGGAVGADLVRIAVEAASLLPDSGSWCVITGPNLPQADHDAAVAAAPPHLTVVRFRQDFAGLLGRARLSVSQAGYNTVCDILRARCDSIVVPFVGGGETEQAARAARLKALGIADTVSGDALDADRLAVAIRAALARPAGNQHSLDIEGAANTARLVRQLLHPKQRG